MATNDSTRYEELKARVEALGYELLTNDAGAQFVLDGTEVVFVHRSDDDDDIGDWLARREEPNAEAAPAPDDQQEDEPPTFGQLYETALKKFKAVASITYLLGNDDNTDQVMLDAANHASDIAREGADLMQDLWDRHLEEYVSVTQSEGGSSDEWTPRTIDEEQKRIAKELLAMPPSTYLEFTSLLINAGLSKQRRAQSVDLLNRGRSVKHVNAFVFLSGSGDIVLKAAAPTNTSGGAS